MQKTVRRVFVGFVAITATVTLAACGSDSNDTNSGSSGETPAASEINLTPESFTVDFSAMEQLKPLVEKGDGLIGVLLPDTTSSARYESFDRPYLQKALRELPNHKRIRKIFFVNGWLGAFIGGQRSEEALAIVNKFLADNPNLDNDLRLKILENVDVIERAVRIRERGRLRPQ